MLQGIHSQASAPIEGHCNILLGQQLLGDVAYSRQIGAHTHQSILLPPSLRSEALGIYKSCILNIAPKGVKLALCGQNKS